MPHADLHGLNLTTASAAAADAFNDTVLSYLRYRSDISANLLKTLAADPGFAFGHVLKGYLTMLGYKQALVPAAVEALRTAEGLLDGASGREKAHAGALGAWISGDLDRAIGTWEQILDEHPTDVLALRLHHFNAFWLGRPGAMARQAEKALPQWGSDLPGWGTLLACRCFAHEELGNYTLAEASGRDAIDFDKGDLWAAHAVAHILEMQGRCGEGIDWLAGLEPYWEGANNLKHHLWWHRGLYHFERGEFDTVLELYDRHFRNLSSPLTQAQPDLYIDIQNAASMLFRLELPWRRRQGPLGGDRRQGRGADRRLPVALHAAALDDGAGRDAALRSRRTDAGGDAQVLSRHDDQRAHGAGLRDADQRSPAAPRARRSRLPRAASCARRSAACSASAAATPSRTSSSSSSSTAPSPPAATTTFR